MTSPPPSWTPWSRPTGRPTADRAALIPLRKNAAWWALTQDERRHIFEAQSHHTQIGLDYLPAIARRLHHCRDLGEPQPFDFLTWFEFAAHGLFWVAALVTLITGYQYLAQTRKALDAEA